MVDIYLPSDNWDKREEKLKLIYEVVLPKLIEVLEPLVEMRRNFEKVEKSTAELYLSLRQLSYSLNPEKSLYDNSKELV